MPELHTVQTVSVHQGARGDWKKDRAQVAVHAPGDKGKHVSKTFHIQRDRKDPVMWRTRDGHVKFVQTDHGFKLW